VESDDPENPANEVRPIGEGYVYPKIDDDPDSTTNSTRVITRVRNAGHKRPYHAGKR
jgi:hypothetical protein